MPETRTLEALSPELQQRILCQLGDLHTLSTLIRASPRFYQVFRLNKDTTLSTIVLSLFHPVVRPEAIAVAKLAQLRLQSHGSTRSQRDTALSFCDSFPRQIHLWSNSTALGSISTHLCKLAGAVEFFIADYTRNTLPILDQLGKSQDFAILSEYPPNSHDLHPQASPTEIGRLQRAFCRIELYRLLFSRCSLDVADSVHKYRRDPLLTATEQAKIFLESLPPFQITEIACIRDYLFRRLRGICDNLEDEAVQTLPFEAMNFGRFHETAMETARCKSPFYIFTTEAQHEQEQHLEHLISLGLSYIRQIIQSTGDKQRDLFLHFVRPSVVFHLDTDFLSKALRSLGPNPNAIRHYNAFEDIEKEFTPACDENGYSEPPQGWLWGHFHLQPYMLWNGRHKGLRDWGYVFWDLKRLQDSGILCRE